MATKKQKREAAAAKREQFLKEEKERGLEAQRVDKVRQAKELEQAKVLARHINHKYSAVLRDAGINN